MALTTSFALATHALVLLASREETGATSDFIANSASTHPARVRRVLAALGRSGIVEGREGAGGGYRLGRPAAGITLAEVFDVVVDGPVFPLHPREPNAACPVGRGITHALEELDREALLGLREALSRRTVAWLVERVQEGATAAS
ncbi:MAG TPA: Rrf2 family transcriptional regulator [Longimicrobiales bacterium]